MLDEQLLEEATALSGERTFSRTIERALGEMVRRLKARRLLDWKGSGIWQGNLGEMRGDLQASATGSMPTAMRERPAVYRPRAKTPAGKKPAGRK